MNAAKLSKALRDLAATVRRREDPKTGFPTSEDSDVAELICVLARIVEGKPLARSFGAPGDWGYDNPIGQALAAQPDPQTA